MKVFKFGGASVKDATGVQNLLSVLKKTNETELVIVVSAMGKMTNSFEELVTNYFKDQKDAKASVAAIYDFHQEIMKVLFMNPSHPVYTEVASFIKSLQQFLNTNKSKQHAFVYDQIVCVGELISTTIISHYLSDHGVKNNFLDIRNCIKTDANYRDANVDWSITQKRIVSEINTKGITVTQGFISSEQKHNFTTTLGREGSDYSAAIIGYCLNAESVTIWKDVPGVLNADPRHFKETQLLNHISYREAIELAFYGASVIHPKTLQPLQRKEIPLFVKSFYSPLDAGTCVGKGVTLDPLVSCFILKKNQVLISLSSLDFSFMMENHIGDVFKLLHTYKMKVELIQNSAISFSVCVDNKYDKLEELLSKLREKFRVTWNENVTLYTIRYANREEILNIINKRNVLVKQESGETVQLVIKE